MFHCRFLPVVAALMAVLWGMPGCRPQQTKSNLAGSMAMKTEDIHSFSLPQQVRVQHVHLDLQVQFERKVLGGFAVLEFERTGPAQELILDTRRLVIRSAEVSRGDDHFVQTGFVLGAEDPVLGSPLRVSLPPDSRRVRILYETSPSASGLQWCTAAQTAGKAKPFLYSQSQAIHARSWIPIQDSPGIRVTYTARIRVPEGFRAVMSAESKSASGGVFDFEMRQAVPAYLIALAVGDLEFRPIGPRTGIYAEPLLAELAAQEFGDSERMLAVAEQLYGPYRWGRYDILVLPPSFPFGGMENPMVTFATPTVLAGDKSLVSLISHELAHSWSGNLVTNATWSDFWLNEGFTTYIEWRLQEAIYGRDRAEMEVALAISQLREEMKSLPAGDQKLYVNLVGRDPDDAMTEVPYVKGALLLRSLEEAYGRPRFDAFLRSYFGHFAFQSVTTRQFLEYLKSELLDTEGAPRVAVEEWVYQPGLPSTARQPRTQAFQDVERWAERWAAGAVSAAALPYPRWSTLERLYFLDRIPEDLDARSLEELDKAWNLTSTGNAEILSRWLKRCVRSGYRPGRGRLERFLMEVGRRKYIKPLYEELVKTEEGRREAERIFSKARAGYHPIAAASIEAVLGRKR